MKYYIVLAILCLFCTEALCLVYRATLGFSNPSHKRYNILEKSTMCTNRFDSMFMLQALRSQGTGGSVKIDKKTAQKTNSKISYKGKIEKDWRLILHDDTIHTIQQVCDIVTLCCPLCTGSRAYEVTLEVHMNGAATVAIANKKIIEEYTKSMQSAGLTVSMAPDDEFEVTNTVEADSE